MYDAYFLTAGLLSVCVYLYAVTLLTGPHAWFERTGNLTYALAILVVPIYAGLFLSARLAERVAVSHVAWAAPAVAASVGGGWVVLSQLVVLRIRRRLGEQDRAAKLVQWARQESDSLSQAREFFASDHYDLCVIESWRAMVARFLQVLLIMKVVPRSEDPDSVIHAAVKKGVLKEPNLGLVEDLKRHWMVAVSTEPLAREDAVAALSAVRHVLAVVAVKHGPAKVGAGNGAGGRGRRPAWGHRPSRSATGSRSDGLVEGAWIQGAGGTSQPWIFAPISWARLSASASGKPGLIPGRLCPVAVSQASLRSLCRCWTSLRTSGPCGKRGRTCFAARRRR